MNQGTPEDCKPQLSLQGDYTFTDRELQDVLGFLEMMNGPGNRAQSHGSGMPEHLRSSRSGSMEFGMLDDIGEFVSRPALLPPPSAGLQFQPRLPRADAMQETGAGASGLFSPAHSSLDQSRDATSSMNFGAFAPGTCTTVNGVGVMTLNGGAGMQCAQEPKACRAGSPGEREEGPAKVSHGASEKQRRDRINSMIDQLRKLVPPGGGSRGTVRSPPGMPPPSPELCALEGRRSKYVVLAETIQLVTLLMHQVKEKDAELEQLRGVVRALEHNPAAPERPPQPVATTACRTADPMETSLKEEMMSSKVPSAADMDALPTTPSSPAEESPARPEEPGPEVRELEVESDLHAAHSRSEALSVVIDMSPNHCYIKVTCKDRRGLLSDILTAIAPLPLEVKRAAITTSASNIVTDIFEVKLDEPNSLSPEDLRQAVLNNLYHMGDVGIKRKK